MDRRKLTVSSKVSGSTLVEMLIAMVTIVVIFGIAMMIFSNVTRSSVAMKKIRAQAVLNDLLQKALSSPVISNDSFVLDGLQVEQTAKPYHDDPQLTEVDLAAYDSNHLLLFTLKQVLITPYE